MANHVHNRLTVVKGSAEEVLKFVSEQPNALEPDIYTTKLELQIGADAEETERVNVTNASPSVGFDTLWEPLKEEQVQALLERFPEYEIIYHFSEEMGNFSDEEYRFVNGELVKRTLFPNWRLAVENYYSNAEVVEVMHNGQMATFRIAVLFSNNGVLHGLEVHTDEAAGRYKVGDKVRVAGLTIRLTDGTQLEVTGVREIPSERA